MNCFLIAQTLYGNSSVIHQNSKSNFCGLTHLAFLIFKEKIILNFLHIFGLLRGNNKILINYLTLKNKEKIILHFNHIFMDVSFRSSFSIGTLKKGIVYTLHFFEKNAKEESTYLKGHNT